MLPVLQSSNDTFESSLVSRLIFITRCYLSLSINLRWFNLTMKRNLCHTQVGNKLHQSKFSNLSVIYLSTFAFVLSIVACGLPFLRYVTGRLRLRGFDEAWRCLLCYGVLRWKYHNITGGVNFQLWLKIPQDYWWCQLSNNDFTWRFGLTAITVDSHPNQLNSGIVAMVWIVTCLMVNNESENDWFAANL